MEMDLRKVEGYRVYVGVETTKWGRQQVGGEREEISDDS